MADDRLSAHFRRSEFATCDECHPTVVSMDLVRKLEALRTLVGNKPLRIVSGFRCPPCNARKGGAPKSQHLYGKAADIPAGYATVAQAKTAGFTGIGSKGRWAIHVDVRPHQARWTYDAVEQLHLLGIPVAQPPC